MTLTCHLTKVAANSQKLLPLRCYNVSHTWSVGGLLHFCHTLFRADKNLPCRKNRLPVSLEGGDENHGRNLRRSEEVCYSIWIPATTTRLASEVDSNTIVDLAVKPFKLKV